MNGIMRIAAAFVAVAGGLSLGAGEVEVVKAVYGAGDAVIDVTETVKTKAVNISGVLFMLTPSNAMFGKDPAPKIGKTLDLTYRQDGSEKNVKIRENTPLILLDNATAAKEFKILKAFYGTKEKWLDVTEKVADAIGQGKEILVDNALFTDPVPKKPKQLVIIYTVNDQIKSLSVSERGKLAPDAFKK